MKSNKERMKARYKQLKALGVCVRCRAQTRDGHVYCDACNARCAQYLKEHAKQVNEAHRNSYKKRRDMGLCGVCGKRPAIPGRAMCEECRMKNTERRRARDRAGVQPQHQAD